MVQVLCLALLPQEQSFPAASAEMVLDLRNGPQTARGEA